MCIFDYRVSQGTLSVQFWSAGAYQNRRASGELVATSFLDFETHDARLVVDRVSHHMQPSGRMRNDCTV